MTDDDEDWIAALESDPWFIISQMHTGHVLTEADIVTLQTLLSQNEAKEEAAIDEFHRGREDAFREIGGEDLLTAIQLKDHERIAKHVRRAMDKLFPPERRKLQ